MILSRNLSRNLLDMSRGSWGEECGQVAGRWGADGVGA